MDTRKHFEEISAALVEAGMPTQHLRHSHLCEEMLAELSDDPAPAQIKEAALEAIRRHVQRSQRARILAHSAKASK